MIVVHHLEESRSQRVLWLLEELELPYEVKRYDRNPQTRLAPPELREIHALGKSPVVVKDGKVLAESGAIVEFLAESEGGGRFSVAASDPGRAQYLYWLHFAEGSAMLPLLLKLYVGMLGDAGSVLMQARIEPEIEKYLGYFDAALKDGDYLVGNRLTAADIEMSFVMDIAKMRGGIDRFPNLMRVRAAHQRRPAYQRALERGGPYKLGA